MKKLMILIIVIITMGTIYFFNKNQKDKRRDVEIPILLYHDFVKNVPDEDNFNYINTSESFEENIKVIIENGYTIISMKELDDAYNGRIELPEKPILINFDDGYYSNYEYIYPILKKYNVKVSIFIVTDKIGKEMDGIKYLSWNDCLEMQNGGLVEIFSHSKRHMFYNRFPIKEISQDVIESYKLIEEKLGKKDFKVFAYPYGAYTKQTVRRLKNIGIDMQVYNLGVNNFKNFNRNHVKRINIPCEMTGIEILDII